MVGSTENSWGGRVKYAVVSARLTHVAVGDVVIAVMGDKSGTPRLLALLRKVTVEPVLFLYMFSLYLLFAVFQGRSSIDSQKSYLESSRE